jgi:hypothetical protein
MGEVINAYRILSGRRSEGTTWGIEAWNGFGVCTDSLVSG